MNCTLPEEFLAPAEIDPAWFDGPFANLKQRPAISKGKLFEQIAENLIKQKFPELIMSKRQCSDYDINLWGWRVEIKGSTTTKGSTDSYSFLQIRPDQEYDQLMLVTFAGDGTVEFYLIAKPDLMSLIDQGIFGAQHGGKKGNSGILSYNGNMTPFKNYFWFGCKVENKVVYG